VPVDPTPQGGQPSRVAQRRGASRLRIGQHVELHVPGHTRLAGHEADPGPAPVYHHLENRIHAHILLRWLALLLVRIAETTTAETWPVIRADLERLHRSPSPAPPAPSGRPPN